MIGADPHAPARSMCSARVTIGVGALALILALQLDLDDLRVLPDPERRVPAGGSHEIGRRMLDGEVEVLVRRYSVAQGDICKSGPPSGEPWVVGSEAEAQAA